MRPPPRIRYLRVAPITARLTVPLETRLGVQQAGTILRRLGSDLERMGAAADAEQVAAMLFQAWTLVKAAERELKLRARIDQAGRSEAGPPAGGGG